MTDYYIASRIGSPDPTFKPPLLIRRSKLGYFLTGVRHINSPSLVHIKRRIGDPDASVESLSANLLTTAPDSEKNKVTGYNFTRIETPFGCRIGRVSRPIKGWTSVSFFQPNSASTVKTYSERLQQTLHLFERLLQFGKSVDLVLTNLEVHGNETRDLLLISCLQVEALFKLLVFKDYRTEKGNISQYWKISEYAKLPEYEVRFPDIPMLGTFAPFSSWDATVTSSYAPLRWYRSYNHVKHNAVDGNAEATLVSAIEAIAACFILLSVFRRSAFANQFLSKRNANLFNEACEFVRRPEWELKDSYLSPPNRHLRFLSVT